MTPAQKAAYESLSLRERVNKLELVILRAANALQRARKVGPHTLWDTSYKVEERLRKVLPK